jgi:hypothetical protein
LNRSFIATAPQFAGRAIAPAMTPTVQPGVIAWTHRYLKRFQRAVPAIRVLDRIAIAVRDIKFIILNRREVFRAPAGLGSA